MSLRRLDTDCSSMARFFQRPAMFAALAACAVLVLAQAADAAAADSARALGFMDSLRGHQPDTAAHKAAAKTASSATAGGCYNGETTTTSLRAVQWKDCGSRPSELVYPFFFTVSTHQTSPLQHQLGTAHTLGSCWLDNTARTCERAPFASHPIHALLPADRPRL